MSTTQLPASADDTKAVPVAAAAVDSPTADGTQMSATVGDVRVAAGDRETTHRAPAPWDEPADVGPASWTAEPRGRHRRAQSSVRPAATAVLSGLISLVFGRQDLSSARHAPATASRHRQISA